MSKLYKVGQDIGGESGEAVSGVSTADPGPGGPGEMSEKEKIEEEKGKKEEEELERAKKEENLEQLGRLLSASLKSVDRGIDKGIKEGFATSRGGAFEEFIGSLHQLIAPLSGEMPSRGLERKVRSSSFLELSNKVINKESKESFQKHVIRASASLYSSNFDDFMRVVDESPRFKSNTVNDTSHIRALSMEYKSADESTSTITENSPRKIILKKLIPQLRSKFDAIETFREDVGEGSNIDYEGIGEIFASGSESKGHIDQLEGLYRAIDDWAVSFKSFQTHDRTRRSGDDKKKKKKEKETSPSGTLPSFEEVSKNIEISEVLTGPGVSRGVNPGELVIARSSLGPTDSPYIRLLLTGSSAKYVKPVGKDSDYFRYFVHNNKIILKDQSGASIPPYITAVTSENVREGAVLTVYFNPTIILQETGSSSDLVQFMEVKTQAGERTILASDSSLLDDLIKLSSATSTTPLYETVSPSGEKVAFTPADIVLGGGKITDSKGNRFKVKKRKGKSLADRVMSPSFGKVKRGLK